MSRPDAPASMFTGLSAFPITPADAAGRVDAPGLRRLLARLVAAGVDSVGLLGSTGTYAYLSRDERRRAVEVAAETLGGRVPLLVGIGALRTDEAVRLARDARAAGADAGLLAPMSYTPLTDDEVFAHVAEVARAGELPICLYNNPGTTHFTVSPDLVGRLAAVPGVVAVKNPAAAPDAVAAQHEDLRGRVPAAFSLGYSIDAHAAEALLAGGQCWYSVAGGLFPAPCLAIARAVRRGDAEEARRLDRALEPLWQLFARHSSIRVVHAAAGLLGLADAEPPRPIQPLPAPVREEIAAVLGRLELS